VPGQRAITADHAVLGTSDDERDGRPFHRSNLPVSRRSAKRAIGGA
jgi:hypothetical protein